MRGSPHPLTRGPTVIYDTGSREGLSVDHVGVVMHLRTSQDADAQAVERWLSQHDLHSNVCRDAFELCARALRQPEIMPDLVLVGLDWLSPDDLAVCDHVSDTWPAAVVVGYTHGERVPDHLSPPPHVRCFPLPQLLRLKPADLLRRSVRDSASESVARRADAPHPPTRPIALTREELAALLDDDKA